MTNDCGSVKDERRTHHAVRDVFLQACALLTPLMKENDKALSTSNFAMTHIVQEHFPELSSSETRVVIAAVARLHCENRLQSLPEQ